MNIDLPTSIAESDRLYVPWVADRPLTSIGLPLAHRLQAHHERPLTIVCTGSRHAPAASGTAPIVTERHGHVADGGIVLVHNPTFQLARKIVHLPHSVIIVVEREGVSYRGWARISRAYDLAANETLSDGLSTAGHAAVEGVIALGDLGWTDAPARAAATPHLNLLVQLGEFSTEVITAYARQRRRDENAIQGLVKFLDEFTATVRRRRTGTAQHGPRLHLL